MTLLLSIILHSRNAVLQYEWESETLDTPEVTLVIPVFEQEKIISENLRSIFLSMSTPFDAIIIDDASKDKSLDFIRDTIQSLLSDERVRSLSRRICVFSNKRAWFETRCDDFAFRMARGTYIIEFQADMKMHEIGFDQKLLDQMVLDPSLLAISARGVHKRDLLGRIGGTDVPDIFILERLFRRLVKVFIRIPKYVNKFFSRVQSNHLEEECVLAPSHSQLNWKISDGIPGLETEFTGSAGWLGPLIDNLPHNFSQDFQNLVYRSQHTPVKGETIMRGPIIVDKTKYLALGGFNTRAFYQGNDDHDLWLRGQQAGYQVAFYPLYFSAPTNLGSARKKRSFVTKAWSKTQRWARRKYFRTSALYVFFK